MTRTAGRHAGRGHGRSWRRDPAHYALVLGCVMFATATVIGGILVITMAL